MSSKTAQGSPPAPNTPTCSRKMKNGPVNTDRAIFYFLRLLIQLEIKVRVM